MTMAEFPFRACGEDVTIHDRARIVQPEHISIGDSVIVDDFVFLMGGASTTIGSFVHIAAFASLVGGGELVVGNFAGISGGTRLYTGNDDYLGGGLTGPTVPARFRKVERSFVRIGDHAIIGANSVILPGVTIGEGAAIGAGSLIKSDCEPWTVYAGSPARAVKARPRDVIRKLEAQLRSELYDANGRYIPKRERGE